MIEFKTGNIIEENVEALVNTVNCVGIMGRGVALQFKKAWPANFKSYSSACRRQAVQPGLMFVFKTGQLTNPKYIINFPTKRHWRGLSRLEDIDSGLKALVEEIRIRGIKTIALPPLGSGLGGLHWQDVKELIERNLGDLDKVRVIVFEPTNLKENADSQEKKKIPAMTPGRAALVLLMSRYLAGFIDPFVSLLEIHKLMFFLQEAGEPLRLRIVKGPYGPYAENLRHVLREIEGYYITGFSWGGDDPSRNLALLPGAVRDANELLQNKPETVSRLERVAQLLQGFESPFGIELLATVYWIGKKENSFTDRDIINHTYAWNDRKRQFSERQIIIAKNVLYDHGWLQPMTIS